MDNRFFILSSDKEDTKLSLNIKRVEFGVVAIIEVIRGELPLEILFTDVAGENAYDRIIGSVQVVMLGKEFVANDTIMVDVFSGGKPIISKTIDAKKEDKEPKQEELSRIAFSLADDIYNDNIINADDFCITEEEMDITEEEDEATSRDYYKEAARLIKKAKSIYGEKAEEQSKENKQLEKEDKNKEKDQELSLLMETIKENFNILYEMGEEDYSLKRYFPFSEWKRLVLKEGVHLLGKLEIDGINVIAIALHKLYKDNQNTLGKNATFIESSIYDLSGYEILVQDLKTGKALKVGK